jgi:hypothetical protein
MRRTSELWVLDIFEINSSASGRLLGICPRGNHRDDDIVTISMIYYVFIGYPLKTTCINWQLCELFVKLFYLYGFSKVVPDRSLCEDTHEY